MEVKPKEAAASAASSTSKDGLLNDEAAMITLDGRLHAVADLPEAARDIPGSRQFAQMQSPPLEGALSVSQTAHVAYRGALMSGSAQADGMMIR